MLSGTFYLGMGDQFDAKKAKTLPQGSFFFMDPEMHHFAFNHGPVIVQLHGEGPWKIIYVNPKDDTRNQQTSAN